MEKEGQKHRFRWRWLAALLTVVSLLLLIGSTAQERAALSWPEQLLREFARPIQSSLNWLASQIERLPIYLGGVAELQAEYETLQQEASHLRYQLSRTYGLQYQNRQLQELLGLAESIPAWQPLAARVISRSQTTWQQSLIIDKGSADGLRNGQPVLAAQGLVGRINQTSPHTAEVLLLTGPESAVAAVLAESRWAGTVEADSQNPGGLALIHVPLLAEGQPGEPVISSGLGGVYPYGLPIGIIGVAEPTADGLSQQLQIEPYADFDRLEQLLVLRAEDASGAYDLPLESLLPGTEPEVPAFAPLPLETEEEEQAQALPHSIPSPGEQVEAEGQSTPDPDEKATQTGAGDQLPQPENPQSEEEL